MGLFVWRCVVIVGFFEIWYFGLIDGLLCLTFCSFDLICCLRVARLVFFRFVVWDLRCFGGLLVRLWVYGDGRFYDLDSFGWFWFGCLVRFCVICWFWIVCLVSSGRALVWVVLLVWYRLVFVCLCWFSALCFEIEWLTLVLTEFLLFVWLGLFWFVWSGFELEFCLFGWICVYLVLDLFVCFVGAGVWVVCVVWCCMLWVELFEFGVRWNFSETWCFLVDFCDKCGFLGFAVFNIVPVCLFGVTLLIWLF